MESEGYDVPGERDRFVKRIGGVPGDVIELRDNRLLVNGRYAEYHTLDARLHADVRAEAPDGDWFGQEIVAGLAHAVMLAANNPNPSSFEPLVGPDGHSFVMGDNRDNSKDSRFFGFVSRDASSAASAGSPSRLIRIAIKRRAGGASSSRLLESSEGDTLTAPSRPPLTDPRT